MNEMTTRNLIFFFSSRQSTLPPFHVYPPLSNIHLVTPYLSSIQSYHPFLTFVQLFSKFSKFSIIHSVPFYSFILRLSRESGITFPCFRSSSIPFPSHSSSSMPFPCHTSSSITFPCHTSSSIPFPCHTSSSIPYPSHPSMSIANLSNPSSSLPCSFHLLNFFLLTVIHSFLLTLFFIQPIPFSNPGLSKCMIAPYHLIL